MVKERRVIGVISQRLGNIIFQIGAYMTYAKNTNRNLYLTIGPNEWEWYYFKYDNLFSKFAFLEYDAVMALKNDSDSSFYHEPYDSHYVDIPFFNTSTVVLSGFFQNEKYFDVKLVKDFFTVPSEVKKEIEEKYGDLSEATSISVRHGNDYLIRKGGTITPKSFWYEEAYEKYFPNTKVIITSDDLKWAMENIKIKNAIYSRYSHKKDDFWDMYVCMMCKNHITYPGSYGWLGAWLNEQKDSKVICPDKWWGVNFQQMSNEIMPDRWIKFGDGTYDHYYD